MNSVLVKRINNISCFELVMNIENLKFSLMTAMKEVATETDILYLLVFSILCYFRFIISVNIVFFLLNLLHLN